MPLSQKQIDSLAKGREYRIKLYKGLRDIKKRTKTTKKKPRADLRNDGCCVCYDSHEERSQLVFCPICSNWMCEECVASIGIFATCPMCATGKVKDFVMFHKKQ